MFGHSSLHQLGSALLPESCMQQILPLLPVTAQHMLQDSCTRVEHRVGMCNVCC